MILDNKEVLIIPITQNIDEQTILDKFTKVPIVNNEFEYDLKCKTVEAYNIIFTEEIQDELICSREFFPDTSIVEINIYANEDKNEIIGGKFNRLKRNTEDFWTLHIPVILTPNSGHIDPPWILGTKNG